MSNLRGLGEPDIKVGGFQLWVHGRQFPDAMDEWDGNWLKVSAHCGELGASVWVSGRLFMLHDLARWSRECDELAMRRASKASLEPLEPELSIDIRPVDTLGHFAFNASITPDHLMQKHSFEFRIDQTELREIAKQCRRILATYPLRGK